MAGFCQHNHERSPLTIRIAIRFLKRMICKNDYSFNFIMYFLYTYLVICICNYLNSYKVLVSKTVLKTEYLMVGCHNT
jgi:hypothetical protein